MSDESQASESIQVFPQQPLYLLKSKLPKNLCNEIVDYFHTLPSQKATTVGYQENLRDTTVTWCDTNDWGGPFMFNYLNHANSHLFQYDIDGCYFNQCHMLTYNPGQWYGWHTDTNEMDALAYEPPGHNKYLNYPMKEWVRKLAFTLQLSDPDEYEGGDVELAVNDDLEDPITLPKERGQMCIFDTRTKHRVLPVTKGTRHTLVGWAIGPRWK